MKSFFDAFWCTYKDNPLEGRNGIIASFCPQVFGLYVVKLCICLALVGGVQLLMSLALVLEALENLKFLKFASSLRPHLHSNENDAIGFYPDIISFNVKLILLMLPELQYVYWRVL
uniref:Uncharacterized protein n=1 Tax=Amphimedon queenslandica TaxID=400682 RepID=A0A1X7TRS1_AMPQE